MLDRDLTSTVIFLSTLLEPVVSLIEAKYPVIRQNYIRVSNCQTDWGRHACEVEHAVDTIVDVWTLASCNEVWGGASNMLVFVACLNPRSQVKMLPMLGQFRGA